MNSSIIELGVTHELSNGKLTRIDIDDEHYYFLDGQFCIGMTTVLDLGAPFPRQLREWLRRTDNDDSTQVMEYKRDRGSFLHHALDQLMNGVSIASDDYKSDYEKKAIKTFIEFIRFLRPSKFKTELTVADADLRVAGTLDFVGVVDERRLEMLLDARKYLTRDADDNFVPQEKWAHLLDGDPKYIKIIIDWKFTGRTVYNHKLQVTGYGNMYAKSFSDERPVDRMFTWRFDPRYKAGFDFKESTFPYSSFERIYETTIEYLGGFPEPPEIVVYPDRFVLFKAVGNRDEHGFLEGEVGIKEEK